MRTATADARQFALSHAEPSVDPDALILSGLGAMVVAQTHLEDRLEELRTGTGDPASEAILVQALSKAIQDTVKTAIQASKLGIQSKIETRNLAIQADFMVCMDAALFDEGVNLSETQRRAFRERFRAEVMLHTGYDK